MTGEDLPEMTFLDADQLEHWLERNHDVSRGVWIRVFKKGSGVRSVSFEEVLDLGLRFGWSESRRRSGDDRSYLQRFTPLRTVGTTSRRNIVRATALREEGCMRASGLRALGWESG